MPSAASPARTPPSSRERLIAAMGDAVRRRGLHGVGLAEVLAAAATPKGVLYHHFPGGKTALAVAAVDAAGARVLASLDRVLRECPDPVAVAASFARVRVPIAAANATDDPWAPPRSRDAFMAGYRNAPWEGIDIDPAAAGTGPLGHMRYFRPRAARLWDEALDWLEAHRRA